MVVPKVLRYIVSLPPYRDTYRIDSSYQYTALVISIIIGDVNKLSRIIGTRGLQSTQGQRLKRTTC